MSSAASGSFDLNVYAGTGVEGALLQSTHFSWVTDLDTVYSSNTWYTFILDNAVSVVSGSNYTFSIENLSANDVFRATVSGSSSDPYTEGVYMHQGYQMPNQYHEGSAARDISFQTIIIPEPATFSSIIFVIGLSLFIRRRFLE